MSVLGAPGQLAYALGKLLGGPVVDACGGAKSLVAILGRPGSKAVSRREIPEKTGHLNGKIIDYL